MKTVKVGKDYTHCHSRYHYQRKAPNIERHVFERYEFAVKARDDILYELCQHERHNEQLGNSQQYHGKRTDNVDSRHGVYERAKERHEKSRKQIALKCVRAYGGCVAAKFACYHGGSRCRGAEQACQHSFGNKFGKCGRLEKFYYQKRAAQTEHCLQYERCRMPRTGFHVADIHLAECEKQCGKHRHGHKRFDKAESEMFERKQRLDIGKREIKNGACGHGNGKQPHFQETYYAINGFHR